MTVEQAQQLAKQTLTPKRYTHEQNVVDAAIQLAQQYGASPKQAALAGWLHDIVKEQSQPELLRLLQQDDIIAKSTQKRPVPVWHGPCAAVFAKHQLNVQDADVLSAIGCHTTGKPGMQLLDKILFVADMISAERNFSGVEELRTLAFENLDAAVIAIMQQSIAYVQKQGRPLDEETIDALKSMQKQIGAGRSG
ncbi:bis(5'-nucleosyl)-tetraphosphatase (symmetrical) YqeK [Ruminococcaceae bacterium OttesenSCG-928-A16]|nr:bis(5'-nucleosyl)-tetraphosphatase (symmetrical) YqeK [Ruminococcaceae bacterium OttesenSCG-928-A16]